MSLFNELKRRNVFRVGLFYIVSAWLIVQVAETLLPIFDVPDGVLRAIVLILVLGFLPALVFAWAFELTPDGLKRDKDVQHIDPQVKQQTSQKLNWATMIAALLAIGVVVADRMLPQSTPSNETAALEQTTVEPDAGAPSSAEAVESSPQPAQTAEPQRTSIAVLAFENMSSDPENAFFAEGISEEILNVLAGVNGLKVASRTSAFSLSGRDTPIPEIAAQLGVDHVLEGSVRKAGNRVRITAQLIDAADDAHLWSDVYDRELDDIFAVQEEIARAITGALTGILETGRVSINAPTENLEAYQAFLRGRSRFYQRLELDEAIVDLRRAVELDPEFAQAWAVLAASEYVVGGGGYPTAMDQEQVKQRAAESVNRALALNPTSAIAQAVKGQLLIELGGVDRIREGLDMLEQAAATVSPDSTPKLWFGLLLLELGDAERALGVFEQAHEQDPLVAINNGYLGVTYVLVGQQQRGERFALRSVELSGSLTFWVNLLAIGLANDGQANQAVALLTEAEAALDVDDTLTPGLIDALNDNLTYAEYAERNLDSPPPGLAYSAMVTASLLLGEVDIALTQALGPIDGPRYLLMFSAWLPSMSALREHPEFYRWMTELGYIDYWRTNGFPLGCAEVQDEGRARLECEGAP